MKRIKLTLPAIVLSIACSAMAHADGVIHTPNGDVRYTTERIGTDLWVTYWKDGEQIRREHYTVDPDGSLRLLNEE
jgi:hypothetical protein